jgi:hypothetical protein
VGTLLRGTARVTWASGTDATATVTP